MYSFEEAADLRWSKPGGEYGYHIDIHQVPNHALSQFSDFVPRSYFNALSLHSTDFKREESSRSYPSFLNRRWARSFPEATSDIKRCNRR